MNCFKTDIYRYFGKTHLNLKEKILLPSGLKIIKNYRRCKKYNKVPFLNYFFKYRLKRINDKYLCQLSHKTKIGKGIYLGHAYGIIINPSTVIGDNVNIAQSVTIGQENRGKRKGCPTISSNVWIGAGAVIVGKINIGENVLVAPNSFVNFDVPSNSIVIGNPGKIIHSENATKDYINNIVN